MDSLPNLLDLTQRLPISKHVLFLNNSFVEVSLKLLVANDSSRHIFCIRIQKVNIQHKSSLDKKQKHNKALALLNLNQDGISKHKLRNMFYQHRSCFSKTLGYTHVAKSQELCILTTSKDQRKLLFGSWYEDQWLFPQKYFGSQGERALLFTKQMNFG